MRTCTIELGTDEVRLLDSRLRDGRVESATLTSDAVVLGASIDATGAITRSAERDALHAVARSIDVWRAQAQGAGISAVAPHVLGAARNAQGLVDAIRRRHGLAVTMLSGRATTRLVYRAARAEFPELDGQVSCVHVGDCGLDFASGTRATVDLAETRELGVARLHRAYGAGDTGLARGDASALFSLVRLSAGPAARRLREWGAPRLLFTGAAVGALRSVARAWRFMGQDSTVIGRVEIHGLASEILGARRDELEDLGVDPRRTPLLGTTAVVLDAVADLLGRRDLLLGTSAPAEGVALEILSRPVYRLASGA